MRSLGLTEAAIRRIRAHEQVIEIALRIENDELAQAIIDLSRTARRELLTIGMISTYTEQYASSYEMILTQHLMPEIASRLILGAQTPMLLSREEVGDGSTARLGPGDLRRLTGQCWSRSDFGRIGAVVRARLDPDGRNADKVFATEVIGQEPCNGNLLEIALGRVATPDMQPPSFSEDWFAERILHAGRLRGLDPPRPIWTPEMRFGYRSFPIGETEPETTSPEPV